LLFRGRNYIIYRYNRHKGGGVKNLKFALVALLIGITIFSAVQYGSSLQEKYRLRQALSQLKSEAKALEDENKQLQETLRQDKELQDALSQQNADLKDYLKASKKRMSKLFSGLKQAEKTLDRLETQQEELKSENKALIRSRSNLKADFSATAKENEELKARMNSLAELKKAIRELKHRVHSAKGKIEQKTAKAIRNEPIDGNRGFVIKDGKPTQSAKIKIEVAPALEN